MGIGVLSLATNFNIIVSVAFLIIGLGIFASDYHSSSPPYELI
jgi:hypothetical protein